MKNKIWLFSAIFIAIVYLGCTGSGGSSSLAEVKFGKDASYALGLNYGANTKGGMEEEGIALDLDEFLKGMKDGITGKGLRFSMEQARTIFDEAYNAAKEEQRVKAEQIENAFLAENTKKPGIIITESGLQYEVITEGSGPKPTDQDKVRVHFEAKFTNDTIFQNTYDQGEPQVIGIDQLFPGFAEGLQLMSVGSKYKLYIPSALAFGETGYSDPWSGQIIVPPFAAIIYEIELLEINPAGE